MGNCLRKPMRDSTEGNGLIANAAKPAAAAPSPVTEEDLELRPAPGLHENPLASLAAKGQRRGDDGDDGRAYGGRDHYNSRRDRRGRYSDEDDDDDGGRRRGGGGSGGRGGRRGRYSDDDGDDKNYDDDEDGYGRRPRRPRDRRGRDDEDDDKDDDDDERLDDRRRNRNGNSAPPVRSAGGRSNKPFGEDDADERPAAGARRKPAANPFADDEHDDRADTRSTRTAATQRTAGTQRGGNNNDDNSASIKSKGPQRQQQQQQQQQEAAGAKRPPFEGVAPSTFAADARALRNSQLQGGKGSSARSTRDHNSGDDDDDDDDGGSSQFDGSSMGGGGGKRPKLTQFGQLKKKICSIKLAVEYNVKRQTLIVHVFDVEGLSERKFGKPNLYVKMYVSPDPKRKTKRKSNVVEKNSTPNFDERFEFKVPATEIQMKSLRLALWESGAVANTSLGELSIGFSNYAAKGDFSFSEYFAISRKTRNPPDPNAPNPTGAISGPEDVDSDDAKSVRSVRSTMSTESGRNPFGDSDDDDSRSVMTSGSVIATTPKPTERSVKRKKLCNIKLSVGYNSIAGVLRVHVQELGEIPWEEDSKPDLYIKMFVAPDPNKETKRKTRVVNNNLAPKFDELFEWKVQESEIRSKSLIVSLCEEGTLSNDILGEMSIAFHNFTGDFEWNDWFAINKKSALQGRLSLTRRRISKKDVREYTPEDPNDARSTHSNDEVIKPQLTEAASNKTAIAHVKLDISYEAARGTFKLHVHKVKGLLNYAAMDLYIHLWLHPDREKTERKTNVQRNTKAPDFDEVFEYKYAVGEVQRKSLVLQLWHDLSNGGEDKTRNKMLAQVTIGFKSTEGANFAWSDWYALFDKSK